MTRTSLGAARKPTNVVGFYEKAGYSIVRKKRDFIVMEKRL